MCLMEEHWGGGGGGSDAKVPLRSGLCDMNDIVDKISTAAVCVGHQVPGGHHPSCSKKKKKKNVMLIPAPATATARASCLLNADDHN